ncbi:MAG: hypothetical protein KDA53_04600 [Hyphomonas sp.]|nr:hypothetical protein [Hyphomonas sp.]
MAAPDIGLHLLQEFFRGRKVASGWPALDPDHPFPVLADALVVNRRHLGGDGERRGGRIGTQAKVRAEDIAVRGDLIEQADDVARHALGRLAGRTLAAIECVGIVEDAEVDIAGIVELEGAHLAEGNGEEAGLGKALLVQRHAHRRVHRIAGKVGQRAGHVHDRQLAGKVFAGERQVRGKLRPAQRHHRLFHGGFARQGAHGGQRIAPVPGKFPVHQAAQVRRVVTRGGEGAGGRV